MYGSRLSLFLGHAQQIVEAGLRSSSRRTRHVLAHVPTDTETCQVDAGMSWLGAGPVQLEDNQDPKRSWPASCSELCLPQLHNPTPVASFRTYAQVKWKLTSLATSLAVTTVSAHLLRWSVSESLACSQTLSWKSRVRGRPDNGHIRVGTV